jgi:hypothetical protein
MLQLNLIALLIASVQFSGSQGTKVQKETCFLMPSTDLLLVVANQPDCPIEFVNAHCVAFLDGGGRDVYQIRNRSSKAIKGYTIAIVSSEGTEAEHSVSITDPHHYFLPEQIRPKSLEEYALEIVPLTDEMRSKYNLKRKLRAIKIFIVVEVRFSDGSVYDSGPTYASLKAFFRGNPVSSSEEQKGIRQR